MIFLEIKLPEYSTSNTCHSHLKINKFLSESRLYVWVTSKIFFNFNLLYAELSILNLYLFRNYLKNRIIRTCGHLRKSKIKCISHLIGMQLRLNTNFKRDSFRVVRMGIYFYIKKSIYLPKISFSIDSMAAANRGRWLSLAAESAPRWGML